MKSESRPSEPKSAIDVRLKSDIEARTARLRRAVKEAGGNQAVARRADMHVGTLNNYLGGRDMKAAALTALADACRVSVEWLATGRGSMHAEWINPATLDPPTEGTDVVVGPILPLSGPRESALFSSVDIDRLTAAIEGAIHAFSARGAAPGGRRFAQVVLLLYDELTNRGRE